MTASQPTPAAELQQTSPEEASRLVTEQLTAYVAELRVLGPDDWSRPTDCARWDVRQIAADSPKRSTSCSKRTVAITRDRPS
jgi:hypothetical protein